MTNHSHLLSPTRAGERLAVLVAEDNAVNMEVARFHLADLGCISTGAVDGAEAVALLQQMPIDVILMDCEMPVMDGFTAARRIRALEATGQTPRTTIIAVTGTDDPTQREQCSAAGFDGFLSKPFNVAQLRSALLVGTAENSVAPQHCPDNTEGAFDRAAVCSFAAEFGLDTTPVLIGSFVKLLKESAARYTTSDASRNAAMLHALSHKLAGAAATVGASGLAAVARDIDRACKNGSFAWRQQDARLAALLDTAIMAFEPLATTEGLTRFLDRGAIA